jgi:hypothetical protein
MTNKEVHQGVTPILSAYARAQDDDDESALVFRNM